MEIVVPGNKSANEEVTNHVNGDEHLGLVKAFSEKDLRKKHQSLLEALREETLTHVSDGLVRCVYCKVILNDSLTNLKNHLVSLDHIFEEFGFGNDADKTVKRKSAKMIYLVAQTADLDFHKMGDTTKIICKRCEYIIEPTFQTVKYHLDSKKHNSRNPTDMDDNGDYESAPAKGRKTQRSGNSPASSASPEKKAKKARTPRSTSKRLKFDDQIPVVSKEEVHDEIIALTQEDGQQYFVVGEFCLNEHQFISEGMEGMEQTVIIAPANEEQIVNEDGEIVEQVELEVVSELPEESVTSQDEEEDGGQKELPPADEE